MTDSEPVRSPGQDLTFNEGLAETERSEDPPTAKPRQDRAQAGEMASHIHTEIVIEDERWLGIAGLEEAVARSANAAAALAQAAPGEIAVQLADDEAVRALNARFRGQDKPTNVLSFPQDSHFLGESGARYWGDIILGFETVAKEAQAEGKSLHDHLCHLIVHASLHLFGYDHETTEAAERMEALEVRALAGLGIADPYADRNEPAAQE